MESNILRQLWNKLMEALKVKQPLPASISNGTGLENEFSVNSHGVRIRGKIYFPSDKPSKLYPVLIICHGIPGSGQARPADDPGYEILAESYARLGIASVFFNFRGCGDSEGNFDMMGWTWDLEAVLDKIVNTPHIDPTRVMVLGFSGGGAAAIRVSAEKSNIFALAVVGTPADFSIFDHDPAEIVADFRERGIIRDPDFPKNIEKWLGDFRTIEPSHWVSQFRGKHLLIMHGDADELVPVEHARQLFESAPQGIAQLIIIPDGVHRLRLDPRCIGQLENWYIKILGWKKSDQT